MDEEHSRTVMQLKPLRLNKFPIQYFCMIVLSRKDTDNTRERAAAFLKSITPRFGADKVIDIKDEGQLGRIFKTDRILYEATEAYYREHKGATRPHNPLNRPNELWHIDVRNRNWKAMCKHSLLHRQIMYLRHNFRSCIISASYLKEVDNFIRAQKDATVVMDLVTFTRDAVNIWNSSMFRYLTLDQFRTVVSGQLETGRILCIFSADLPLDSEPIPMSDREEVMAYIRVIS